MPTPLIVDGDTHSHGGHVNASASTSSTDGRAHICEGDIAVCHIHGLTQVATATSLIWVNERRVALEGDLLACGALLRSSQRISLSEAS